jgi:hypothetical protein
MLGLLKPGEGSFALFVALYDTSQVITRWGVSKNSGSQIFFVPLPEKNLGAAIEIKLLPGISDFKGLID